jgi:hypothetical protein
MPGHRTVTCQEALDIVESLPEYQQEDLINIIGRRRLERHGELLAKHIKSRVCPRGDHAGHCRRPDERAGTMRSLTKSAPMTKSISFAKGLGVGPSLALFGAIPCLILRHSPKTWVS